MASKIYTAAAETKRDSGTIEIGGTVEAGDKFWVDIGTGRVLISASSTSTATTATELHAALEATDIAQFGQIEWEVNASTITWLGPDDGRPVNQGISVGATESNDGAADAQTITKTVTQAGTGKYSYTNLANWSGGSLPVSTDDVHLGAADACPKYDIDGQDAVAPANLYVHASDRAGQAVGLPAWNEEGGYLEYLPRYLEMVPVVTYIGVGEGEEVPEVRLNTKSSVADIRVLRCGPRGNDGVAPVSLLISNTNAVLAVTEGAVDVAVHAGETTSLWTLNTLGPDADVHLGPGLGWGGSSGVVAMNGGRCVNRGSLAITSQTLRTGSEMRIEDGASGTVVTSTVDGGASLDVRRACTITTLIASGRVTYEHAPAAGSKTITNCDLFAGAEFQDPFKLVTFSNGVDLNQCTEEDVTLNLGRHVRITRGSVA